MQKKKNKKGRHQSAAILRSSSWICNRREEKKKKKKNNNPPLPGEGRKSNRPIPLFFGRGEKKKGGTCSTIRSPKRLTKLSSFPLRATTKSKEKKKKGKKFATRKIGGGKRTTSLWHGGDPSLPWLQTREKKKKKGGRTVAQG